MKELCGLSVGTFQIDVCAVIGYVHEVRCEYVVVWVQ